MITIEEIFSLTKSELKSKLLEYEDKTQYLNNLERINAVIIHSFNNSLLNSKEMKIVESDNYDRVMKLNPTSYLEFLELLNPKKKSNKINININPKLLKSWNTPKVTTLEEHDYIVMSVAVSGIINTPDKFGKQYIISGSVDKTIKIWDISTYELVEILEEHRNTVRSVAVSGIINTSDEFGNIISKQYIISASDDKTIKIWNFSTFKLVASLEGHTNGINSVAVSGKYIISGSFDKTIKIWDLSTFKLVTTLEGHTDWINCVAVSSINNTTDKFGKQYIILASDDKTIKIWDLSTFKLVETLEGHTNSVNSVAVSSINNTTDKFGKQYIISASDDKTIKIWNFSTFKLVASLEGHTNGINSVAVSDIINTTDEFGNNIEKQYIISGSRDGTIKIWDFSTFKLVETLEGHTDIVTSVAVSSDNKYIISGSRDKTIKFWDLSTFELMTTLGNDTYVYSVAISSDNKYIISGLYNGKIKIWEKN